MSVLAGVCFGIGGSIGTLLVCYLFWLIWTRTAKAVKGLTDAAQAVPKLVAANEKLTKALNNNYIVINALAWELGQLRQAMMPGAPPAGSVPAPQQTRGRTRTEFPSMDWDQVRYDAAPDATMEDTDIELLSQTDEDLLDMERLEELRRAGVEPEAGAEDPEGITTEA